MAERTTGSSSGLSSTSVLKRCIKERRKACAFEEMNGLKSWLMGQQRSERRQGACREASGAGIGCVGFGEPQLQGEQSLETSMPSRDAA